MYRSLEAVCFGLTVIAALLHTAKSSAHEDHDPPIQGAIFPQLSADGDAIVFSYQGAIWRTSRLGGEMLRLTHDEGFDCWPAWSPSGEHIAFVRGSSSFSGPVHLIRASDGAEVELPRRPASNGKLAFSPDGKQLLGVFKHDSGNVAHCAFNLETGTFGDELRGHAYGQRFAFSRDAKTLALSVTQDPPEQQQGVDGPMCDIWLIPTDGEASEHLVEFSGRVYDLSWKADGSGLFVVTNVGGVHNDLWEVPLDDPVKGATKITFGQADEDAPTTDATGRWLLYTDNRRGPTALVVRDRLSLNERIVTISQRDFAAPTGVLSLELQDNDNRELVTARVSVQDVHGKFHCPPSALYRLRGRQMHFYANGKTQMDVPAGQYVVTVSRGPEYVVASREIDVPAEGGVHETIELKRWTNQRAKKWYSGESHIHANYGYGEWYNSPRTMLAQSAGEDLIVSNFMVANSEADGVFDREYFRGKPDPLSTDETILYWNEEFRSTIWGHMTLLNLKQLVEPVFTGFAHTTNPHDHPTNADIADHTHDQDGHVNYTHPAHNVKDPYLSAYSAKALPLDVALGTVDSIDVMGSNYAATRPLWYRLLNCGFHVPASAGTDCFLNRVRSRLPGQARVYVYVDGVFSYERWIESLKAGRTFVTDGPMFEFTVDGKMAGSTIELDEPGAVRVQGRVVSQEFLGPVEVVSNGEVVATVQLDGQKVDVAVDEHVPCIRSGWIALRAAGGRPPTMFGHTSPVYINVKGQPIDAKEDAEYFIGWIDRLRTDVRRRNRIPSRHQVHVESQIAEAREVFNRLLEPTE